MSLWSAIETACVVVLLIGLILTAQLVFSSLCAGSEFDEYTRSDRLQHEAAGFAIGLGSRLVIESIPATRNLPPLEKALLALAPVVLAGALKEAYDHQYPACHDCDARDFYATCLGGTVAVALTWRF